MRARTSAYRPLLVASAVSATLVGTREAHAQIGAPPPRVHAATPGPDARSESNASPAPASRPAAPERASLRAGAAYVTVGGVGLPLGALDGRLRAQGLPGVANGATTVGSGAYLRVHRLLIGASGHTLLARTQADARWRTSVRGGYALVDVGAAVVAGPRSVVSVMGGVGASRLTMKVRPVAGGGFDSTLAQPARAVELSGHTPLLHAGLTADHLLRWRGDRSLVVGLRAGYVQRAGRSRWQADDVSLGGGPGVSPDGAYVRLSVGAPLSARRHAVLPALGSLLPWVVR